MIQTGDATFLTMFDNVTSDDGEETVYYVVDGDGAKLAEFEDESEALDAAAMEPQWVGATVEEQTLEPAEDDTSEGYSFIQANAEDDADDGGAADRPNRWSLGNHTAAGDDTQESIEDALEGAGDVNDELADLLGQAAAMVEDTQVSGFECPVCGLNHGHSDTKHDIRADDSVGFGVRPEFANEMQFCPYCHCGVNELAMLMDFYGYIVEPVFEDEDFGRVEDLDNETLREVIGLLREQDQGPGEADYVEALSVAGLPVTTEVEADLRSFYDLYTAIKGAADSAPIASETREEIAEFREELEAVTA